MNNELLIALAKMPRGTLIPVDQFPVVVEPDKEVYEYVANLSPRLASAPKEDGPLEVERVTLRRAKFADGWGSEREYWVKQ